MIVTDACEVYSIYIILHSIREQKYFHIKSKTMLRFLVARRDYQVLIPGSRAHFR